MAKRTKTMTATLKAAKKILGGPKRTSTMAATIATASAGFKEKKKATKTRTMAETLKAAAPAPKKTKKVTKKETKKANKKAAKKTKKASKGKKKWSIRVITSNYPKPIHNYTTFITSIPCLSWPYRPQSYLLSRRD